MIILYDQTIKTTIYLMPKMIEIYRLKYTTNKDAVSCIIFKFNPINVSHE